MKAINLLKYFLLAAAATAACGCNGGKVIYVTPPGNLPLISFSLPEDGLTALAGTDYLLAPAVQDEREARFSWTLDGKPAGDGKTYVFNQGETGTYLLTLRTSNRHGSDEKTLAVTVVDELPLEVFFEKPYYGAPSADISMFADRTLYLRPVVEGGGANLLFDWTVDGEQHDGGRVLAFAPAEEGDYEICVTVRTAPDAGDKTTAHAAGEAARTATAKIKVTCRGSEAGGMREAAAGSSAEWDRVCEYLPAPGQFINEVAAGFSDIITMEDAAEYAEKRMRGGGFVSLGGFGGYIIVGFDHSIRNTGSYQGYDFAIDGNQFGQSSEPGIVWVMQDVNGNGLPDDVWYELRGSEYGRPETLRDYAVTYARPAAPRNSTPWSDNRGNTGYVSHLASFHPQDYYYPGWVAERRYTLRGTCLSPRNRETPAGWRNEPYEWGYADNMGSDQLSDEDNSAEKPMGVYFKISNAVNCDGSPAGLRYIDFIKVQTGVNAQSGTLGEISSEVFSFRDMNIY